MSDTRLVDIGSTLLTDLELPHGPQPSSEGPHAWPWWIVSDKGVRLVTRSSVHRTPGKPLTTDRIWRQIKPWFDKAAAQDRALYTAIVATESRGDVNAARHEPKLSDWSLGPAQVLTRTAFELIRHTPLAPIAPPAPVPSGGSLDAWKKFLCDWRVSSAVMHLYVERAKEKLAMRASAKGVYDPVALYAAYNAGGLYASNTNPWRLRAFGSALDHFAAWYGDACEVTS